MILILIKVVPTKTMIFHQSKDGHMCRIFLRLKYGIWNLEYLAWEWHDKQIDDFETWDTVKSENINKVEVVLMEIIKEKRIPIKDLRLEEIQNWFVRFQRDIKQFKSGL